MQLRELYNFLHETWSETVRLNEEAVDIAMMEYQEDMISRWCSQPEKHDRVNWIKEGF